MGQSWILSECFVQEIDGEDLQKVVSVLTSRNEKRNSAEGMVRRQFMFEIFTVLQIKDYVLHVKYCIRYCCFHMALFKKLPKLLALCIRSYL